MSPFCHYPSGCFVSALTFAARTIDTMEAMRKPWIYKRTGIKGWWVAWYESGKRKAKALPSKALAEDIERHLNQEPVLAGPPGALYRFQKLVRRNKGVFVAVGAVAAVLVLGVIVSTWQAVLATRAEREQSRLREDAVAAWKVAVAAQEKEAALRRQVQAEAYAADMSLAQQALAMNDLGRVQRLLEAHQPAPGEVDLRGWEWRYLWQECRSDALNELYQYPDSAQSLAFSPDGRRLATCSVGRESVRLWDMSTRRELMTLAGQGSGFPFVAFSPDGQWLAACGMEGKLHLWRAPSFAEIEAADKRLESGQSP